MYGVGRDGFVYVARAVRSGLVKIGFTTNAHSRLRSLSAYVGEPVELLSVMRGTRADERALLDKVKPHRVDVRGNAEWHRPHPDVDALVSGLPPESRTSIIVGTAERRVLAPRRSREDCAASAAARFVQSHGHPSDGRRRPDCAACKRSAAAMRGARSSKLRKGAVAAIIAGGAIDTACAAAPTLTGGR